MLRGDTQRVHEFISSIEEREIGFGRAIGHRANVGVRGFPVSAICELW